jgi:hypothetical protein
MISEIESGLQPPSLPFVSRHTPKNASRPVYLAARIGTDQFFVHARLDVNHPRAALGKPCRAAGRNRALCQGRAVSRRAPMVYWMNAAKEGFRWAVVGCIVSFIFHFPFASCHVSLRKLLSPQ